MCLSESQDEAEIPAGARGWQPGRLSEGRKFGILSPEQALDHFKPDWETWPWCWPSTGLRWEEAVATSMRATQICRSVGFRLTRQQDVTFAGQVFRTNH